MNRARVPDGLLAALALAVASWPLTTLLQPSTWARPALLLVLLVAVVGMLGRAAGLRGAAVLLAQLVLIVLTVIWVFLGSHLWYGLPTRQTLEDARALVEETVTTVTNFAAPAPTSAAVVFVVAASLALLATAIDYLAVTRRSPALAGLVLLAVFLVSAANSGSSLNPVYFLALAFMWLLLLARQGSSLLRRWSSTDATPATPTRDLDDVRGTAGHASVARALGVSTLVLAIALPAVLPHLPPHYFADGLGRSVSGSGGRGTVGFTQTLDLTADLASRDSTPVITYRTNDPTPPPLRVSTTSHYEDGKWLPEQVSPKHVATSTSPKVPAPVGLQDDVERTKYRIKVQTNRLNAPRLAAPSPLVGADLDGVEWGIDRDDGSVLVSRRPSHYQATFLAIGRDVTARTFAADPTKLPGVTPEDLILDPRSSDRVRTLATRVVGSAKTPLGKAIKIQDYLRDPSRFSYSLTLAAPRQDSHGNRLDPISHFLVTKQGYCTQFATAMIMMARAEGIPARMAVGFLPGVEGGNDLYTVTQSNAHAWPELYVPDLGWTRFEPTPAVRSGEPPAYAEQAPAEVTPGGRPLNGGEAAPPAAQPGPPKRDISSHLPDGADIVPAPAPSASPWWDRLPFAVGALVLVLLAGLVVPLAGRYRRRHLARSPGRDRVEAQWAAFSSRMSDYGIAEPRGRTPRQLQRYYQQHTRLDERAAAAMDRVLQTLEQSRYAVPSSQPLTIGADSREVLRDVTRTRSWTTRLRVLLWPRSGREQLRLWGRAAANLVGRPGQALGDRVDGWEAKQRRRRAKPSGQSR
jgi:transglutaminase-like putative cysteine protease